MIANGKNKERVLETAKIKLDKFILEYFDYWTTFDEENTTVSGKARYGELPPIVELSSEKGQKLLKDGMKATKKDILKGIKEIRKAFEEKTDEEIYNTLEDEYTVRAQMDNLGRFISPTYWVYDITVYSHFDRVGNEKSLQRTLDHAEKHNNKLWIIPVDVHY